MGIEADNNIEVLDAGPLEVIEDISEDGLATEVEEGLVMAVAEVLEAGAEARSRDESLHPLLRKAFRSLGQRFRPSDRRNTTLRPVLKKRPVAKCSTWNSFPRKTQVARGID